MFLQSQEMRGKRCACSAQFHEKTRKRIASENMHLFLRVPERYKKAAIIISEKDGISLELRKNMNISRIDISNRSDSDHIVFLLIRFTLFEPLDFISPHPDKTRAEKTGDNSANYSGEGGTRCRCSKHCRWSDDKLLPVALLHRFYIGHLRHAGWHAHHTIWRYLWAVCHNVWYSRDTHQSFFI